MGKCDHSRTLVNDIECIGIDSPVLMQIKPAQFGTGCLTQLLPGNKVRMVFSPSYDNAIPRSERKRVACALPQPSRIANRQGHKVNRLGCILRPHDFVGSRTDKARKDRATFFKSGS